MSSNGRKIFEAVKRIHQFYLAGNLREAERLLSKVIDGDLDKEEN